MAEKTNISWTDATYNVARGCTPVSEGCARCYMMRDGDRYKYDGRVVQRTKTVFTMPLKYKETKSAVWPGRPLIFTSSLTDFFHKDIDSFRHEAWDIIRKCPHLIFQILTKQPERIMENLPPDWGKGWDNVWLGVSVENQRRADERIPILLDIPVKERFLSCEPLLESIDITMYLYTRYIMGGPRHESNKVSWVIVGGESGNDTGRWKYRPCDDVWIAMIVDQCKSAKVPVFVKQMGTHIAKKYGMTRHGADINQFHPFFFFLYFPEP